MQVVNIRCTCNCFIFVFLAAGKVDENMDESDKRKSPRSPKKIKMEPDSEKGEVKDAAQGTAQSEMDISKSTEKDQGKGPRGR